MKQRDPVRQMAADAGVGTAKADTAVTAVLPTLTGTFTGDEA